MVLAPASDFFWPLPVSLLRPEGSSEYRNARNLAHPAQILHWTARLLPTLQFHVLVRVEGYFQVGVAHLTSTVSDMYGAFVFAPIDGLNPKSRDCTRARLECTVVHMSVLATKLTIINRDPVRDKELATMYHDRVRSFDNNLAMVVRTCVTCLLRRVSGTCHCDTAGIVVTGTSTWHASIVGLKFDLRASYQT